MIGCPEVIPCEVRAQIDQLAYEQRNLKLELSIKDMLLVEVRWVKPQMLWRRTGRMTRAI